MLKKDNHTHTGIHVGTRGSPHLKKKKKAGGEITYFPLDSNIQSPGQKRGSGAFLF